MNDQEIITQRKTYQPTYRDTGEINDTLRTHIEQIFHFIEKSSDIPNVWRVILPEIKHKTPDEQQFIVSKGLSPKYLSTPLVKKILEEETSTVIFGKPFPNDYYLQFKDYLEKISAWNKQQSDQGEYVNNIDIPDMGSFFNTMIFMNVREQNNRKRGKQKHNPFSSDDVTQVQPWLEAFEGVLNEYHIPPLLSLLHIKKRSMIDQELRNSLETLFYQNYGTNDSSLDNSAYITPDEENPHGSITTATQQEINFWQQRTSSSDIHDYINFLQQISTALKRQQIIEISNTVRIRQGSSWRHYDHFDPFTTMIPDQEAYDIGIVTNYPANEKNHFVATIPSTWKTLALEYLFFEYNTEFAFGPRVILPALFGDKTSYDQDINNFNAHL